MLRSFRFRLLCCAAILLVIFLVVLMPIMREAFDQAVRQFSNVRLEERANELITAAKVVDGELTLPSTLQDLRLPASKTGKQLGYFYTSKGDKVELGHIKEYGSTDRRMDFSKDSLLSSEGKADFRLSTDSLGRHYYVYDKEINLGGPDFSVVTMEPVTEYDVLRTSFLRRFEVWLIIALVCLLALIAAGLTWSLRPLRRLKYQLDEIEAGKREQLDEDVPSEIYRLTRSLNRLLTTERLQRERYQDTLGDLAHSLKTPLTVLQNTIDEMRDAQPNNSNQLKIMQAQIDRMGQQIGYQLQRATQRKGALIGKRISLRPLIDSLTATLNKVYADKHINIEVDISYSIKLHAEEAALLELFGNLLENACRLCFSTVKVSANVTEQEVVLLIEDDGPGVPLAKRQSVLQRGVRGDSLNPGQGIGLAVVQDILEGYSGYLEIGDSVLGGACFYVHIPI